jgi:hypothetical protein
MKSLITTLAFLKYIMNNLLFFWKEIPKQLAQDRIIENLDQAQDPEWHEIVNYNIDIFEIYRE